MATKEKDKDKVNEKDRAKAIPLIETELPEQYNELFAEEEVLGCFKGLRDLVIFTDVRIVSIDVMGITGKKKIITTIPYHHICEMTIETPGYIHLDTDLFIETTAGASMAYSFIKCKNVKTIQSKIAQRMV